MNFKNILKLAGAAYASVSLYGATSIFRLAKEHPLWPVLSLPVKVFGVLAAIVAYPIALAAEHITIAIIETEAEHDEWSTLEQYAMMQNSIIDTIKNSYGVDLSDRMIPEIAQIVEIILGQKDYEKIFQDVLEGLDGEDPVIHFDFGDGSEDIVGRLQELIDASSQDG